tara:strand:- start:601 stop:816 length:216 start_codon:yes stop_codon:yes gene_type:complete
MNQTQNDMILVALKNGERITPLSALESFGCFRLSARIWDLRNEGHSIKTRHISTPQGKVVAEYSYEEIATQ